MWWSQYIGIPFEEKGRAPECKGLDCWGLVQLAYREQLEIELPGYLECYETTNDRDALAAVIGEESREKWEPITAPRSLDVIILRLRGRPMHVGLVTKPGYMIHCLRGVGVAYERYDSMKWRSNVIGFVRHGKSSDIRIAAALRDSQ